MTFLHAYRCRICGTTATMPFRTRFGSALRCNLCRSNMTHLYGEPVNTATKQAQANRGLVYNPTTPQIPKRCDNAPCGRLVTRLGVWRDADKLGFCSRECAAAYDALQQPKVVARV